MAAPAVKREAVVHLNALLGLSERRERRCGPMAPYQSQRTTDTVLQGRSRDLAHERCRFGYRRLFGLLRHKGEASGVNRIHRLCSAEGVTVANARRAAGHRHQGPIHDQFACGRRFGCPTGLRRHG